VWTHGAGQALLELQRQSASRNEVLSYLRGQSRLAILRLKFTTQTTHPENSATKWLDKTFGRCGVKEQFYILELDEEFLVISITDRGAKLVRRGFNSREEALQAFPQAG